MSRYVGRRRLEIIKLDSASRAWVVIPFVSRTPRPTWEAFDTLDGRSVHITDKSDGTTTHDRRAFHLLKLHKMYDGPPSP
ncbi:MAG TPA: hypothetical protein P5307_27075, partial [Pirellulaceae bacterium]|nr:hypothetical protein [Pirellulaceae bacterium]